MDKINIVLSIFYPIKQEFLWKNRALYNYVNDGFMQGVDISD